MLRRNANNTMKNELLKDKVFWNISEVTTSVATAVDFYNNQRPHMSVGMMTPTEASYAIGERDMKWYSLRQAAIKRSDLEAVNCHCSLSHSYQRLTSDLQSSVNL